MPVKRVGVALSSLMDDQLYQLDFYEDQERSVKIGGHYK
ncbi:hypothetical protein ABH897_001029 [Paenibacillus sp. RC73]